MATPPVRRKATRITDDKWKTYIKYLNLNYSEVEAARKAQIAHSTVMLQKKNPTSNLNRMLSAAGDESAGLFSPDKVKGDAKRALEDFGYFRQRYFARSTSPWQEDAAYKILDLASTGQKEYVVVNVAPGVGKDVALDTPLLTTNGWKTMATVEVGDYLYDEKGLPTRIVAKSEIFTDHPCYTVTSDDGASVVAGSDHLWPVRLGGYGKYSYKIKQDYVGKTGPKPISQDGIHLQTTEKLARKRHKRAELQVADPLSIPMSNLIVDPYVLGIWLGDGDKSGGRISQSSADTDYLIPIIESLGYKTTRTGKNYFHIKGLSKQLTSLGILGNKSIPTDYLLAHADQRLSLLQGLIDTDGYVSPEGIIEFCNTNYNLASGVLFLARSLGVKSFISESRAVLNGKDCGPRWRVTFMLKDAARLPRKAVRTRNGVRTPNRYLTVTRGRTVPTQCVQVEGDSHCYLVGSGLMVTHNSTFFAHDLPIWLAVKDRTRRTMIGSRTASQAQNYTGRIRKAFERSYLVKADAELLARGLAQDATGNLIADYGRFKPTNADRWRVDEFFLAQAEGVEIEDKEPNFASYGMDGDVLGNRFNFVIWDDLVDRSNTKTEDARDNLIQLWESAMENRLEPNGLLILQGQRIASNDLYRYALDQVEFNELDMEDESVEKKKIYHHIVYKSHYDELCGVDGAGKPTHKGPWPQGCLLDPFRLPYKEIGRLKANRLNRFLLTYQQEDVDTEGSLIKQEWIDGGQDARGVVYQGCWDNERAIGRWPKNVNGYSVITADPSPTKYWAIQWWAYDSESKNQYLIDLKRSAMDAPEFLDWNNAERCFTGLLEEWWQRSNDQGHPFTTLIVEANAAQRFLLQYDFFKRWSTMRNVTLVSHQTNRNKSDEDYGVQTLAPHYQAGRVRFPGGGMYLEGKAVLKPMLKELVAWPEGSTDDCVMAHWFLIWNAPNLFDYNNSTPPEFKRPSWVSGRRFRS